MISIFSRRHPYLFFLMTVLLFLSLAAVAVSLTVAWTVRSVASGGWRPSGAERVGVVEVLGPIADARRVLEELKRFREDEDVKAVVVRIDSPGGAVAPSQEIFREVRKTAAVKKVVASMGTVAASGGYYAAAAASGIMASGGTITGSIGVIMGFANYRELMEKIGLTPVVIKSGAYKDVGSPVRPMEEDERRFLEAFAEKIHLQFIHDVAEGRGLEADAVAELADGRIFTGKESLDLGLVDRLGNLQDAVAWAAELGGIQGEIAVEYAREPRRTLLDLLLSETSLMRLLDRFFGPRIEARAGG
jgi:protease-4